VCEVIREGHVVARKPHTCRLCGHRIAKGEEYLRQTLRGDDGPYEYKTHLHCSRIATAIWDYVDPDDGMAGDDFITAVHELLDTFVCRWHCDQYDAASKSCPHDGYPEDACVRKFADYLKTHTLVLEAGKMGFAWKMEKKKEPHVTQT